MGLRRDDLKQLRPPALASSQVMAKTVSEPVCANE